MHFKQLDCEEDIKYQLDKMVEREILRPEEADIVNIHNLLQFFRSDLGQRVMRADEVWREKPFNLVISADQFLQNEEAQDCNDKLLLQGVIDLYFREGNELVLVDYKTGLGEKASIMQSYRAQIAIYRQALESILKMKVKESYLYMLDKGDIVLVE
ncbi:PD-(D/E)XK nuclease family protein [Syntrophomonas palmitatica]|uniref:PD-(D/E)XK nuclease family protein n=1 Tax=Syntrophomonas palmitatica TaxID=402877 RepID=UPI0006D24F61|nr:PD-(D/E)XK nuclease family protein [Syntrophomonas palmitatica]